jgi:WS/DGAT/MGAT family acyltransferase
MQQLTGQDAMFLHIESDGFPMHIGGVSIYDQSNSPKGIVRFKDILATFGSRLDRSPIFRRKLATVPFNLDQPYWVDDDNFDLEFHVRHIALPAPGDWRQLCIQVARLHARPLDRQRPLWEAYVIEGLNHIEGVPEGSFALYLKVHHAAMDGATGVQFFSAFSDLSPKPPKITPPAQWQATAAPKTSTLLGRAYLNNLRRPWRMVKLAGQIRPARKRLARGKQEGRFRNIEDKASTRFNGPLSPHRVVDAVKFDFEEIRAIKNFVEGATINDVVLTIVSGALQKYLVSKGETPTHSLVAGCMIDVRDESEREAGGNMIGLMSVNLCSDIEDPLERLVEVHKEALQAKAYAEALGPRIGMDVADSIPVGIQSRVIQLAVGSGLAEKNVMQNTVVTNVPGSPHQLYLCGAQIIDSFGIGPIVPGMGLFHTVSSAVNNKKGSIIIAFVACREVLPDPAFYADCIKTSFTELQAATGAKPAPRQRRTSGKAAAKKPAEKAG